MDRTAVVALGSPSGAARSPRRLGRSGPRVTLLVTDGYYAARGEVTAYRALIHYLRLTYVLLRRSKSVVFCLLVVPGHAVPAPAPVRFAYFRAGEHAGERVRSRLGSCFPGPTDGGHGRRDPATGAASGSRNRKIARADGMGDGPGLGGWDVLRYAGKCPHAVIANPMLHRASRLPPPGPAVHAMLVSRGTDRSVSTNTHLTQ